jgi:hypothetical protein
MMGSIVKNEWKYISLKMGAMGGGIGLILVMITMSNIMNRAQIRHQKIVQQRLQAKQNKKNLREISATLPPIVHSSNNSLIPHTILPTSAILSSSKTQSPEHETDLIKPHTQSPEHETDLIKPHTDLPEHETDLIKPHTNLPEHETDLIKPHTDLPEHETDLIKPHTNLPESEETDEIAITELSPSMNRHEPATYPSHTDILPEDHFEHIDKPTGETTTHNNNTQNSYVWDLVTLKWIWGNK